jgi:membrane-associated phospholipid phosphatase
MLTWSFISRLGGIAVMLPAATAVALWLCAARAWRMALWWSALFVVSLLVTVATKIAFIGWGAGIHYLDFTGVSGHAARATAVIPVLIFLAMQGAQRTARAYGVATGMILGAVVGLSRLMLHAHSISEIIAGCVLGSVVSTVFMHVFDPPRKFTMDRATAACWLVGLIAVTFVSPAPTQRWMISLALYLSGHDRPYIRKNWKLAPPGWHPQKRTSGPSPGTLRG